MIDAAVTFVDALQNAAKVADLEPMPGRQRFAAIAIAVGVAVIVFELVRRRKLREEYSWVWVATSLAVAVLALDQNLLLTLSTWIGAANTASTLFFGALVFLMALALQFSVRLSRLTHRQRTLAQRLALLEEELRRRGAGPGSRSDVENRQPQDQDEVA